MATNYRKFNTISVESGQTRRKYNSIPVQSGQTRRKYNSIPVQSGQTYRKFNVIGVVATEELLDTTCKLSTKKTLYDLISKITTHIVKSIRAKFRTTKENIVFRYISGVVRAFYSIPKYYYLTSKVGTHVESLFMLLSKVRVADVLKIAKDTLSKISVRGPLLELFDLVSKLGIRFVNSPSLLGKITAATLAPLLDLTSKVLVKVVSVPDIDVRRVTVLEGNYITSPTIHLDIDVGYAYEMSFRDDDVDWTDWEPYSTSKEWSFSTGDGVKHIYARFRNITHTSDEYVVEVTLSTISPTIGAITVTDLDGNIISGWTDKTTLQLTLDYPTSHLVPINGVSYAFNEDPDNVADVRLGTIVKSGLTSSVSNNLISISSGVIDVGTTLVNVGGVTDWNIDDVPSTGYKGYVIYIVPSIDTNHLYWKGGEEAPTLSEVVLPTQTQSELWICSFIKDSSGNITNLIDQRETKISFVYTDIQTGTNTLKVRVVDAVGNVSNISSTTISVESPPVMNSILGYTDSSKSVEVSNEGVVNITQIYLEWNDPNSGSDDTFYVTTNGRDPTEVDYDYTTTNNYLLITSLAPQSYSFKVRSITGLLQKSNVIRFGVTISSEDVSNDVVVIANGSLYRQSNKDVQVRSIIYSQRSPAQCSIIRNVLFDSDDPDFVVGSKVQVFYNGTLCFNGHISKKTRILRGSGEQIQYESLGLRAKFDILPFTAKYKDSASSRVTGSKETRDAPIKVYKGLYSGSVVRSLTRGSELEAMTSSSVEYRTTYYDDIFKDILSAIPEVSRVTGLDLLHQWVGEIVFDAQTVSQVIDHIMTECNCMYYITPQNEIVIVSDETPAPSTFELYVGKRGESISTSSPQFNVVSAELSFLSKSLEIAPSDLQSPDYKRVVAEGTYIEERWVEAVPHPSWYGSFGNPVKTTHSDDLDIRYKLEFPNDDYYRRYRLAYHPRSSKLHNTLYSRPGALYVEVSGTRAKEVRDSSVKVRVHYKSGVLYQDPDTGSKRIVGSTTTMTDPDTGEEKEVVVKEDPIDQDTIITIPRYEVIHEKYVDHPSGSLDKDKLDVELSSRYYSEYYDLSTSDFNFDEKEEYSEFVPGAEGAPTVRVQVSIVPRSEESPPEKEEDVVADIYVTPQWVGEVTAEKYSVLVYNKLLGTYQILSQSELGQANSEGVVLGSDHLEAITQSIIEKYRTKVNSYSISEPSVMVLVPVEHPGHFVATSGEGDPTLYIHAPQYLYVSGYQYMRSDYELLKEYADKELEKHTKLSRTGSRSSLVTSQIRSSFVVEGLHLIPLFSSVNIMNTAQTNWESLQLVATSITLDFDNLQTNINTGG